MKNLINKLSNLGLITSNLSLSNDADINLINTIAKQYNLNFSNLTEFYTELLT